MAALYQQEPRVAEGALFKVAKLRVVEAAPASSQIVRAQDLAGTDPKKGSDPGLWASR